MSGMDFHGKLAIGVDIGGTKIAVSLIDLSGKVADKRVFDTNVQRGPWQAVNGIIASIHDIVQRHRISLEETIGIGVACGGPLDHERGLILSPPNLPGWDRIPINEILHREFNLPVALENDANAGAVAEMLFGAGKERRERGRPVKDLLYLTMGTGIGGGLILDGRLYRGITGSAGEVGHMKVVHNGPLCRCGRRGCLEAVCSGPSIARRAREAIEERMANSGTGDPGEVTSMVRLAEGDPLKITAKEVFDAARLGDELARHIVQETAEFLGIGLANLVNILNPEIIVLGTIATRVGDLLLGPVREVVAREAWEEPAGAVEIRGSSLGDYIGDYAAVAALFAEFDPHTALTPLP